MPLVEVSRQRTAAALRRTIGQLESGVMLMAIVLDKNGRVASKKMKLDTPRARVHERRVAGVRTRFVAGSIKQGSALTVCAVELISC